MVISDGVSLVIIYAYEYKCDTDLGPISLTGLLAPFAVNVPCHLMFVCHYVIVNVSYTQNNMYIN